MDYRLFTLTFEGLLIKKIVIRENGKPYYTVTIQGAIKKLLILNPHQGSPKIRIVQPQWHSQKRIFYVDGKKIGSMESPAFSSSYTIQSTYGNYQIVKDSLIGSAHTIMNSTTEVGKMSKRGMLNKEYGIALHPEEHIPFILALITFVIYRRRQKKKKSAG